jgi:tetratricopeptide (TPR) repeat protein
MIRTSARLLGLALLAALAAAASTRAQQLGTITFPTSGAPAAQPAFLEGVKDLHSFQFDEAAVAFQKAQQLDPGFALAYWGEAMSYNHPLWAQLDLEAARKALEKLGPSEAARIAKARTPKERAYLEAAHQLFYGPGDKLARDVAYSKAMARMYEQWPEDHEVSIFYALSLLGTVRPGDAGYRRQALAASIAMRVSRENPQHPGAAHFTIHAFDDPDHAILALPAARAYAAIAPSAAHALHMPSHIFVQLGMWEDVVASNVAAYKAASELNARLKLPEGREDFHTLGWLTYANLMLGRFDEAKRNVETARQTADRNPKDAGIRNGYLGMRARYILETEQWERIPLDAAMPAGGPQDEHANMPGMAAMNAAPPNAGWVFIAGVSAAKLGDLATADRAEAQLRAVRERIERENAYRAKPAAIMEKELGAVVRLARGQTEDAVRLAKEAVDIEATAGAPSGPPEPMKPSLELYGDVLLAAGRAQDAAAAYEQQLLLTPRRTPSVKGLARASAAGGTDTARR